MKRPLQTPVRFRGSDYEVRIKTNKAGKEIAQYYVKQLNRWLPMPVLTARALLAEGRATEA